MIFNVTAKAFTVFMILVGLQTKTSTVYAAESERSELTSSVLKPVEREEIMIFDDENPRISLDGLKTIPLDPTTTQPDSKQKEEAKKGKGTCSLL